MKFNLITQNRLLPVFILFFFVISGLSLMPKQAHACMIFCDTDFDGDGSTPNDGDATVFGTSDNNGGYNPNPPGTFAGDDYNSTHGDSDPSSNNNNGTVTASSEQQVLNMADDITDAEALAMSQAEIDALPLNSPERAAAEIARARATGRDVTVTDGTITVEECINGRGGEWTFPPATTPPPPSEGSYYRQGSYTKPPPCAEDNSCKITAVLEALVSDATTVIAGDERIYSSKSRAIYPNIPIWLRWKGYDQDGNPADACVGTTPDDFTAPKHLALGSFENNDGGAGGVAGVPYPGLADKTNKTFSVKCTRAGAASGSASLTLTADTTACGTGCTEPPVILVNGSDDPVIVRNGDAVVVNWDPLTNKSCTLSQNLATDSANNPNTSDSASYVVTGETTFTITCEDGSDSVTVKVLPKTQET